MRLALATALAACGFSVLTYGGAVQEVAFESVGASGTYNVITDMNDDTGACLSQPYHYSGSLAPFNEELSVHFRGPIQLNQFAVYFPGSSHADNERRHSHPQKHGHGHAYLHNKKKAERDVGVWVTDVMNGVTVSWINQYTGPPAQTPTASPTPTPAATEVANDAASGVTTPAQSPTPTVASAPSESSSAASPGTGWTRSAYYNAQSQTAQGLTFLANLGGGDCSGVWSSTFGNSLSYVNSSGTGCASSSEVLANTVIPSVSEVIIMTDQECGAEGSSCGYYRPGSVAYHGFNGSNKIFLMEFQMPSDDLASAGAESNMPAIWFLNALIPRTAQYGCSCWTSGCGEFDAFETLQSGSMEGTTTVHGNRQGGSPDYFERPETSMLKVAVMMTANSFRTVILDPSTSFGESLSPATLTGTSVGALQDDAAQNTNISIVTLGS